LGAEREGEWGGLSARVETLGTVGFGFGVLGGGGALEGGGGWWVVELWCWLVGECASWGGWFVAGAGVESLRLSRCGRWRARVVVAWAERFLVAVGAGAVVGEVGGAHGCGDGQTADAALFAEAAERCAGRGAAVG